MSWLRRQQFRSYARDAIWIAPLLAMVAALLAVRVVDRIDQATEYSAKLEPAMALVVLGTRASSMFTFIVFVSSALLVTLQLASAQLTPRIVGFLFRDPMIKWTLAAFVFTFTFVLAALVRVNGAVPKLSTTFAAYSSMASLALFLYLIDHVGRTLRANGALRSIGAVERRVTDLQDRAMAEVCDPQGVGGRNQTDDAPSQRTTGVPRA